MGWCARQFRGQGWVRSSRALGPQASPLSRRVVCSAASQAALPEVPARLQLGEGAGSCRGLGDERAQTERKKPREGDEAEAPLAGAARSPARTTATKPQPRDSTDHGARGRPHLPAAAATPGRAGRRRPVPAGPGSRTRRELRSPGGSLTILNLPSEQSLSPVTVSRPRCSLPFPGLPPPTSAGSASVRARKEGRRGAPGGSRAGPGLPRLKSRGTGDQGRSKGVGWGRVGPGRDVPEGREDADLRLISNKQVPLVQHLKMCQVLWWMPPLR